MGKSNLPSLLFFIRLIVASFLLLHLFGLFGFFIAFAYPLWWFFIPQKTPCFLCLHQTIANKEGFCFLCKRKASIIYNPPLSAVFVNMGIILLLSLISLLIILAEIYLLTMIGGIKPKLIYGQRQAKFIIPEKNQFPVNKEFYLDLSVATVSLPINVVQADLQFDHKLLEVKRIDTSQSFATIFTQKDYSNEEGWIRLIGGLPSPGFLGEFGHFARIYFYPKQIGVGKISFMETSRLLANDGKGSDILAQLPSSSVFITQEEEVLGEKTKKSFINAVVEFLKTTFLQK